MLRTSKDLVPATRRGERWWTVIATATTLPFLVRSSIARMQGARERQLQHKGPGASAGTSPATRSGGLAARTSREETLYHSSN